ncbi:hypothetical protein [Salipaludibacillus daqingensis]|uniref:hypothetical protein n=1 Tax=Salipaludibacillus daqingensis TaxID=3041001 RepID=UPI0024733299|nr:hypothetical protein [Salipaludibacillus daqingensis]
MKVWSKTLIFGVMSLVLMACGDAEENENNNNVTGNNETGANLEDSENNDENEEVNNEINENNEANEMGNNANEEDVEADAAELPITIDHDADDNELVFEMDGEEYAHDAELYETEFGKEVKILEGMEVEYEELGNQTKAHFTVEDEDHDMYGLTFTVHEAFTYEGDSVVVSDVDVDRSMTMETSLVENAGHVEQFDSFLIEDDAVPYQFYFEIEGDASKPGQWNEAVRGNDYKQYTFFEVVEEGRYVVILQFPADVDEEFEATALAMALSYGPEGTTAEFDEEEVVEEEEGADEE